MTDYILQEGNNELNVQLTPMPPEEAVLFGKVVDSETGLPVSGVLVTVDGANTYTNSSGDYAIGGLTPGSYTVTFEKEGYYVEVR